MVKITSYFKNFVKVNKFEIKDGKIANLKYGCIIYVDSNLEINKITKLSMKNIYYYKNGVLHKEDGAALIDTKKQVWYQNGKKHRLGGPAIIHNNGTQEWYQNGKKHRLDEPAYISKNIEKWYKEGTLHREDGPALIENGNKCWYKEGKLHREDGPALMHADGYQCWYKENKLHRENGPAIISEYSEEYYQEGKLHRLDGPAIYCPDNETRGTYYVDGYHINMNFMLNILTYKSLEDCSLKKLIFKNLFCIKKYLNDVNFNINTVVV